MSGMQRRAVVEEYGAPEVLRIGKHPGDAVRDTEPRRTPRMHAIDAPVTSEPNEGWCSPSGALVLPRGLTVPHRPRCCSCAGSPCVVRLRCPPANAR